MRKCFLFFNLLHHIYGICAFKKVESPLKFKMNLPFTICSKLPYDVTPEQAMSHEEVRNRLEVSIKTMRTVTDKFLSAIVVSVDKIP